MNKKIRNKFSQYAREPFVSKAEDKVQQHMAAEVNINNIIARYNKTGIAPAVSAVRKRHGEFRDLADHLTDMDKVAKAQQSFAQLPSALRNEFGNSVEGFFRYVKNPANNEQLVKWGILDPKVLEKSPTAAPQPAGAPSHEPAPGSKKDGSLKKPKIHQESSED